jgi:hypothetical protein
VPPAESARISADRDRRSRAGSWASAAVATWTWSAAVFDPALPDRSSTATGSPTPTWPWSMNAHDGWKPKPFLNVGRACSFSEWAPWVAAPQKSCEGRGDDRFRRL